MTDISRSTASRQPDIRVAALLFAALRLRLHMPKVETKSADYVMSLWENKSGAESVASTQQPLSSQTVEAVQMPENRLSHAIDPFDPLKYSIDHPPFDPPGLG